MDGRHLYIAAYDVRAPQRLRDALYAVKGYATGGQKSVYECFLSPADKRDLLAEIDGVLDLSEDSFVLIRLDPRMTPLTLGVAVPPDDPPFFYQG